MKIRRYGLNLKWRVPPKAATRGGCMGMPQQYYDGNLLELLRWIRWDFFEHFHWRVDLAGVPYSHDVLDIRLGKWFLAMRRPSAAMQRDGKQHCGWTFCCLRVPFFIWMKHPWTRAFCENPPAWEVPVWFMSDDETPELLDDEDNDETGNDPDVGWNTQEDTDDRMP